MHIRETNEVEFSFQIDGGKITRRIETSDVSSWRFADEDLCESPQDTTKSTELKTI